MVELECSQSEGARIFGVYCLTMGKTIRQIQVAGREVRRFVQYMADQEQHTDAVRSSFLAVNILCKRIVISTQLQGMIWHVRNVNIFS